jgi:hypothetical protein
LVIVKKNDLLKMIIANFTGLTEKKGLKIQKPIRTIGFELDQYPASAEVTLKLVSGSTGSSEVLINHISLNELLEITATFGGVVQIGATGLVPNRTLGQIGITNGGVIRFEAGDYLELELTNLSTFTTYTVYGMEGELHPEVQDADGNIVNPRGRAIKFNQFSVNAGQRLGVLEIRPAHELVILDKANPALESIKFNYLNGTTAQFTRTELDLRAMEENEVNTLQPQVSMFPANVGEVDIQGIYTWVLEVPDTVKDIEIFTDGSAAYTYYLTEIFH